MERKKSLASSKNKTMKQSTAVKILSGISILSIILVFVMLLWNRSSSNRFDVVLENKDALITSAERFEKASANLTREARSYAATAHKEHYDNYWKEVDTDKNREQALSAMRTIGITEEEEAMISEMAVLSNNLVPLEEQAMTLASRGNTAEAISLLYSDQYEGSVSQINAISF